MLSGFHHPVAEEVAGQEADGGAGAAPQLAEGEDTQEEDSQDQDSEPEEVPQQEENAEGWICIASHIRLQGGYQVNFITLRIIQSPRVSEDSGCEARSTYASSGTINMSWSIRGLVSGNIVSETEEDGDDYDEETEEVDVGESESISLQDVLVSSGEESEQEQDKEEASKRMEAVTTTNTEVNLLAIPTHSRKYQRSSTRAAPGTVRNLMARFQE